MNNNKKRDSLLEDLNDMLNEEDTSTATSAVVVLFAAYMVELAKIDRTATDVVLSDTINLIKEESGWTE